jgi:N-acetylglucosaminyldiphosphoundecaprenol N-acetyl-beta-D-mannosaminyltransferase
VRRTSFQPDLADKILDGRARQNGSALEIVSCQDEGKNVRGYRLKCGQIYLSSVPEKFIFMPRGNQLSQIVTVNAEIFVMAHENPNLRTILSKTTNTIDGRVLQWMCKCLYPTQKILRLAGADFIYELAAHCCRHGQRLFLLGSTERSNSKAVSVLRNRYPGLQVLGFGPSLEESPFDLACRQSILDQIESFRPEHLVVCFGPAKQEHWIQENSSALTRIGVRCAYGLGASIDFVSGVLPRAPRWIQLIGAEWLFRLACQPRARFRRTLAMFRMPYYVANTAPSIERISIPAAQPFDDSE